MVRGPPITTEHHPHTLRNWPKHEEGSTQGNRIEGLKIERTGTDIHRYAVESEAPSDASSTEEKSRAASQRRNDPVSQKAHALGCSARLPSEERTHYHFNRGRKKAHRLI